MDEQNELLIDQLYSSNQYLAGFISSIINAAERRTKGSGKNDFIHSEAVHQRLSEILPNANQLGFNETEIFILCASAYLHDIGRSAGNGEKKHGEISADIITSDISMQYLFPSGEVQNQIAIICKYHDRDINQINELDKDFKLDIRPCYKVNIRKINIRPRLLAAIFKLADELECNSDRILGQRDKKDDCRSHIAGVHINLKTRFINIEFMHGTTPKIEFECIRHLDCMLNELDQFLRSYGFSFKIAKKSQENELIAENEGTELLSELLEDMVKAEIGNKQEFDERSYGRLIDNLGNARMKRVDSIMAILPKRR